mgnify:CR=1 FL=1
MRIILLLSFLISIKNAETITGYDLYRSLNKKNSINAIERNQYISATAYIMGVVNALKYSRIIYENIIANHLDDNNKTRKMGNYLMPFKKNWNQNQYLEMIHFYLKNNPTRLGLSGVEIISLSLFEASIMSSLKL